MDINELNRKVIDEFRANNGKVGAPFAGMDLLLLTTVGARSGESRTKPLAFLAEGDRLIVIASYAGAEKSPPWYFNLVKNPEVDIDTGAEQFQARASVVGEPERTALYAKMVAKYAVFAEYQAKTARVIPVVALSRLR